MKHLHYILDDYGIKENIKALRLAPILTQREVKFIKYSNTNIYNVKLLEIIKQALNETEIQNLLTNNIELVECFI